MGGWRAAALASQFGVAVVGSLVGGVLIGQFLDRWLGTAPAFLLAGLLLGLVASIYLIYTIYRVQVPPGRGASRSAGGPRQPKGQGTPAGPHSGSGAGHSGAADRADLSRRSPDDGGAAGETRDVG